MVGGVWSSQYPSPQPSPRKAGARGPKPAPPNKRAYAPAAFTAPMYMLAMRKMKKMIMIATIAYTA